jgi:hypothetical protein
MKVYNKLENRQGRYATVLAEREGRVLYHAGESGSNQEHFALYCIQPSNKFWNEYQTQ